MPDEQTQARSASAPSEPVLPTLEDLESTVRDLEALTVDEAVRRLAEWWPHLNDRVRARIVQWRWDKKDAKQQLRGYLLLAAAIHRHDRGRSESLIGFAYGKQHKQPARVRALAEMWLCKRPKRASPAFTEIDPSTLPPTLATVLFDDLLRAAEDLPRDTEGAATRQMLVLWLRTLLPALPEEHRRHAEQAMSKVAPGATHSGAPALAAIGAPLPADRGTPTGEGQTESKKSPEPAPSLSSPARPPGTRKGKSEPVPAQPAQPGPGASPEAKVNSVRRAVEGAATLLAELDRSLKSQQDAWDQERRTLRLKAERLREELERTQESAVSEAGRMHERLRAVVAESESVESRYRALETELARTTDELRTYRTEADGLRAELTKERELRIEAVSKERSESQRRLREQVALAVGPEFAKIPDAAAPDAGSFALKLLSAIRQRLKAQGIDA